MNFHPSTFNHEPAIWAIVPVKRLLASKRRLAGVLSAHQRADLMRGMLRQSLTVLHRCADIAQVLVISGDAEVLAMAARHGAETIDEGTNSGLNPAVTRATAFATEQGATAVLILPVDLPFLQHDDVMQVIAAGGNGRTTIVLCSDNRQEGTNALFLPVPTTFRYQYGPGSFQKHLMEARHLGRFQHTVQVPGIQFDLDTEHDWQNYQVTMNNERLTINN